MFENFYSTARWTLPSSFSTITSLYPIFHRVRTKFIDRLSFQIPTLAETLQREGYQTVFIGGGAYFLNQLNGGIRGYDLVTDRPIEQILSDVSKKSKPWFIHYYRGDLHMPYMIPEDAQPMENLVAPEGFPITNSDFYPIFNTYLKEHYAEVFTQKAIDEYRSIILSPDKPNDTSVAELYFKLDAGNQYEYFIDIWKALFNAYMATIDTTKSSDVAYMRMMYDTKINILDNQLEGLLKNLSSGPLAKNTVTVLTSSHGESFGEHGTFSHDENYHSELFHTPLIIRSQQLPNKQVEQASSNIDIFPTLLELVGIKRPAGLQGNSLVPNISNQKFDFDRFVLSENESGGIILQNQNWLYFLSGEARGIEQSILYNKIIDPLEIVNVFAKYPELTQLLYKQASLVRSYSDIFLEIRKTYDFNQLKLDPEKVKRLQKEGYF